MSILESYLGTDNVPLMSTSRFIVVYDCPTIQWLRLSMVAPNVIVLFVSERRFEISKFLDLIPIALDWMFKDKPGD